MIKYKKFKNLLLVIILMISFIRYNVSTFANDEENNVVTILDDGIYGGNQCNSNCSSWRIESDGTLYIGEGQLISKESQSIWDSELFDWWLHSDYVHAITQIVFEGDVTASGSQSYLFYALSNVTTIEGLDKLDTSEVTDMSGMFYFMSSLTELNLSSNFNTSKVTNMSGMFHNMHSLRKLNLSSNFNTSKVTNMSGMFSNMLYLTEIDLSSFDTSKVADMSGMFSNMHSLTELDLSSFDTSKVTDMFVMFSRTPNLRELRLGENFDFLSGQDVALNELVDDVNWTGFWQNVGSGTIQNPLGNHIFTSEMLTDQYNGETMADTYVWQPVPENRRFRTIVEVFGDGEVTVSKTTGVEAGDTIELEAIETGAEIFKGWLVVEGNVEIINGTTNPANPNVSFINNGEDVRIIAVFGAVNGQLVGEYLYTSDDIELNLSDVINWNNEGTLTYEIINRADVRRYNIVTGNSYEKVSDVFFSQIEIAAGRYIVGFRPNDTTIATWSTVVVINDITNNEETGTSDNNTNQLTPPTGDINNIIAILRILIISMISIILVLLNKKKSLYKN
jgi:bacterial surface protein 26-residue repeat